MQPFFFFYYFWQILKLQSLGLSVAVAKSCQQTLFQMCPVHRSACEELMGDVTSVSYSLCRYDSSCLPSDHTTPACPGLRSVSQSSVSLDPQSQTKPVTSFLLFY